MRITRFLLPVFCFFSALPAMADREKDPKLLFPLDCTLGETCWTARYNDRQKGKGFEDYMCGDRTQQNHKGIDFAIRDLGIMDHGVHVLAAADGTVEAIRNTMADISVREIGKDVIKGRDCGNLVLLNHANSVSTLYCHMKKDSITLKKGDTVKAGDILGEVGLSGNTEYPHLHLTVRRDGKRIDPFDGQRVNAGCLADKGERVSMWKEPLAYEEMALVYVSLTAEAPKTETRWEPQPTSIPSDSSVLIVTGRVFGAKKGDRWLLEIMKPDGSSFFEAGLTLKEDRQFQLQYVGKKKPEGGFTPGVWEGRVLIIRQRPDGTILKQSQSTTLRIEG